MSRVVSEIQSAIAAALAAMPGVFSTVQWGGRAYKLPGPGSRGTRRPVLLAHVWIEKDEAAIGVAFKLERERARAVVKSHAWIAPHSFRTLAPSGWLTAEVRTKTQCKTLIVLLRETRSLHPVSDPAPVAKPNMRRGNRESSEGVDAVTRRLDTVLARKRAEGWRPRDDDFDRS